LKKIAILQSNYIPWKGYFDIINSVDEFVIYDEVQYTKRDWRNRNLIKTPDGLRWLSIPVIVKGLFRQRICDTLIANESWAPRHFTSIYHNYCDTEYFGKYEELFRQAYKVARKLKFLSEVNKLYLELIMSILGISTKLVYSSDYKNSGNKSEKILDICRQTGAEEYLTGESARIYLDEKLFIQSGVIICWMDYTGYPEYHQLFPPFEHNVSIIDLIFNCGDEAKKYLKSF
jgi:hypothetical protein